MKRLMLSAMASGSGKTVLTCGLMRAFQRRGLQVLGYKCGPDYIDPMFHSRVLGIPGRNLDLFLQGEEGVLRTLGRGKGDLAVLEGAMGFYDGLGGTAQASAWQVAEVTGTPAVLILRPRGQSLSLAAQVRGMRDFRPDSHIAGLFLTDCRPGLYRHLAPVLERETGLPVLGFLAPMAEAELPSRHLGLVTAAEIADLSARFDAVAAALEQQADLDALLALAAESVDITLDNAAVPDGTCRIAVAIDEAFCFYYEDNMDALRREGAELVPFSPVHDTVLPAADGLYLGGGYPELYLEALSENESMRRSIRQAVQAGMPAVAECGGFLYLQQAVRDADGRTWPMAGLLSGTGFPTDRLQRFGYLTIRPDRDSLLFRAGEAVPAHEFHYWDCTEPGTDLTAQKQNSWRFGTATGTLYAAFPHLHFGGQTPMAQRFVRACCRQRGHRT